MKPNLVFLRSHREAIPNGVDNRFARNKSVLPSDRPSGNEPASSRQDLSGLSRHVNRLLTNSIASIEKRTQDFSPSPLYYRSANAETGMRQGLTRIHPVLFGVHRPYTPPGLVVVRTAPYTPPGLVVPRAGRTGPVVVRSPTTRVSIHAAVASVSPRSR